MEWRENWSGQYQSIDAGDTAQVRALRVYDTAVAWQLSHKRKCIFERNEQNTEKMPFLEHITIGLHWYQTERDKAN